MIFFVDGRGCIDLLSTDMHLKRIVHFDGCMMSCRNSIVYATCYMMLTPFGGNIFVL